MMTVCDLFLSRLCQRFSRCWTVNIARYTVNYCQMQPQKHLPMLQPFMSPFLNLQTSSFIRKNLCRHKSKRVQKMELRKKMQPAYQQLRSACIVVTNDKPASQDSILNNLPYLPNIKGNIIACSYHNTQSSCLSDDISLDFDELDPEIEHFHGNLERMFERKQPKDTEDMTPHLDSSSADEFCSAQEKSKEIKILDNVFFIDDTAKTIDEWRGIVDQLSEICKIYSKNVIMKSLMSLFIIGRVHNESDELRNALITPMVQSFVNYLVECDDVLEIAQPSLVIYLGHLLQFEEYDMVMELYQRVNKKIKIYSNNLLLMFVRAANLQSIYSSTYCNNASANLMKLSMTYESVGVSHGIEPFLSLYGIGAFKRKDPETGIKIMIKLIEKSNYLKINHSILNAFLSYHQYTDDKTKWEENREIVESFFNLLYVKSVPLTKRSASFIGKWFQSIKDTDWTLGCFSNQEIYKQRCPVSYIQMKKSILSQNEFECLKQEVLQLLVTQVSQDINQNVKNFYGNTPDLFYISSLPSFTKFLYHLQEEGPFDLIIDGMNIIHTALSNQKIFLGKHRFTRGLIDLGDVLKEYRRRPGNASKKICVVFRKHMQRDVKMDGGFLFGLADIYFTETNSADDAFILYAAISSGTDCYFGSNDLFRNYRFKVRQWCGADILKVFDKYQQTHQTFLQYRNRRHPCLSTAVAYEAVIQKSANTWHFPYLQSKEGMSNIPQDWLCATTKRKASKAYVKRARALIDEGQDGEIMRMHQ